MNNTARVKLYVVVFSLVLAIASVIHAREAQTQQPAPETLQVLKGMQRPQILQEMRKIASALGVECNFCHVNPFSADTPRKAVARLMMRDYTMAMNHKDGSALTCNDCHKGQPNPLRTRPFEGAVGKKSSGLQVLKGMNDAQVTQVMTAFTKALGVECTYCHTADFDDETPRKQIARFMMTEFSRVLVKKDGGAAVGCNDCHQGHARPLAVLPFPKRDERRPASPPPEKKPNG